MNMKGSRKTALLTATMAVALSFVAPPRATLAGSQPVMTGGTVFIPDLPIVRIQSTDEGAGDSQYGGGGGNTFLKVAAFKTGAQVSQAIREAHGFCSRLPSAEYSIDCLAYEYWEIQRRLPDYGELAEAKKVIRDTAAQLKKLAADNRSTIAPAVRISRAGPNPKRTNRDIIPVERSKLPQLSREAAKIVNDGATLLLRATGDSDRLRAQYQQIARSMQTGAIMLRSL